MDVDDTEEIEDFYVMAANLSVIKVTRRTKMHVVNVLQRRLGTNFRHYLRMH